MQFELNLFSIDIPIDMMWSIIHTHKNEVFVVNFQWIDIDLSAYLININDSVRVI